MGAPGTTEHHHALASELRRRWAHGTVEHCIGGRLGPSRGGATFDDRCPADGTRLARVAEGGPEEIDQAARAAAEAFAEWSGTPGAERKRILHAIAERIEARAEELAVLETLDTGQPIRFMASVAHGSAANLRYFAELAPRVEHGECLPARGHLHCTMRQPIGPVGIITPWNAPLMIATWKIAAVLAAGCTVVHKPAELAPLSASVLAELALEAGLPPGVLNVVHGTGEGAGRWLTEHEAIRAIAFVGGSATGARIQGQAAATLKRTQLELGGKNPVLVFEDAELERALDAIVFMIYGLNGERCTSSSRLLVQQSIAERLRPRLVERVKALRVGDPLDPATEIGPMIHPAHRDKVRRYVALAREQGAEVVGGSTAARFGPESCYVDPVLFFGAHNSMRIAQEEIFGPALTVLGFRDEADAVSQANDSPYGLAAYLWTRDTGRAHRVARALEAGTVWVNAHSVRHYDAPFGGMKRSGLGRDGGEHGLRFCMETKNVVVAHDPLPIDRLGVAPAAATPPEP